MTNTRADGSCGSEKVKNVDPKRGPFQTQHSLQSVCSLQRPEGKPAHRPCNAQGPTADFFPGSIDVSASHDVTGGLDRRWAECDFRGSSVALIPEALPVYKLSVGSSSEDDVYFPCQGGQRDIVYAGFSDVTHDCSVEAPPSREYDPLIERWKLRLGWASRMMRSMRGAGIDRFASGQTLSTIFSGVGGAEWAAHFLSTGGITNLWTPGVACEYNAKCRDVLRAFSPSSDIHPDVCAALPPEIAKSCRSGMLDVHGAATHLRDLESLSRTRATDPTCVFATPGGLGDLCVAGIPCTDFSAMGGGAGADGATFILIVAWARALRTARPRAGIVENVARFPLAILEAFVGDLYTLDSIVLCATMFGWPVRRKRLYVILVRRADCALERPLGDILSALSLPWEAAPCTELLVDECGACQLTPAQSRIAADYISFDPKYDPRGFCDLTQRPTSGRGRACGPAAPLFTLTAHTSKAWCADKCRFLHPREHLLAQGFVAYPDLAAHCSCPVFSGSDCLGATTICRMAGNAMHVPTVGAVMLWVAAFVRPRLTSPRDYGLPPVSGCDGADATANAPEVDHGAPTTPRATPCYPTGLTSVFRILLDYTTSWPALEGKRTVHDGSADRMRDIFPLPCLPLALVQTHVGGIRAWDFDDILCIDLATRLCILGLNRIAGYNAPKERLGHTAPQRAVQMRLLDKSRRLCERLASEDFDVDPAMTLALLIDDTDALGVPKTRPLVADNFDLLEHSGLVDPLIDLSPEHAATIGDGDLLFPSMHPGLAAVPNIRRADKDEYCQLVARQLRTRKVELRDHALAGADVFAVGKTNSKLREVWNGHTLSLAAAKPPAPPHIATPEVFPDIEISNHERLYVSKRDASVYFDQLRLPPSIRSWFGRPPVLIGDLIKYGKLSLSEIQDTYVGSANLTDSLLLYPVCCTWPMGFSWSSFIAQSVLLNCCVSAGLGLDVILSADLPIPGREAAVASAARLRNKTNTNSDLSRTAATLAHRYALATDDVMLFTTAPIGCSDPSAGALCALDSTIRDRGIIAAERKNVNDALSETCIGVDFCDGIYVAPNSRKLARLLIALAHCVVTAPRLSALEVSALLGQETWIGLLNRPSLSCFHFIYDLTGTLSSTRRTIEHDVLRELVLFLCVAPTLENDLRRPWQETIVATDASVDFGFGVSVAPLAQDALRAIARHAERPRRYARLDRDGGPSEEATRPRSGTAFSVPLAKSAFRTVISSKRRYDGHSGCLEAHGVALGLRWLLRSVARHSRRTVFLIDAQAVLGGIVRGRSSAPTVRREIAFIGALLLAGDIRLKAAYVPSEENPADEPSRGIVRRWRARRTAVPGRGRRGLAGQCKVPMSVVKPTSKAFQRARATDDDLAATIYRLRHSGPLLSRKAFRNALASSCTSSSSSPGRSSLSISSTFDA